LVIAANRDEFFDRPTAPLSEWLSDAGSSIIGGRDLRGGGAAMALTRSGRIGMLTNVRDPLDKRVYSRSRGELVLRWLESDLPFEIWLNQMQANDFAGFNLIVGDFHAKAWYWVSNRSVSPTHAVQQVLPWHRQALANGQIVTLSNASLSTPWPKSTRLASAMQTTLSANLSSSAPSHESMSKALWLALQNTQTPTDAELPSTGIELALEKALSSCFVDLRQQPNAYGTRSSTLVIGKRIGTGLALRIDEQSWPALPSPAETSKPSTAPPPTLTHYSLGW
jgi:uncharacterized protein with NRDE domain